MTIETILFLGKDPSPLKLIRPAVAETGIEVAHSKDWFSALQTASDSPPKVILVGPDIAVSDIRVFIERSKSNATLKDIPFVLLVSTAYRDVILEFINIGIRSYIIIPCAVATLRNRLACHLSALSDKTPKKSQPSAKSVGERLRQRMERKQMQDLATEIRAPGATPSFPAILLVEQIFTENFGLTIRDSERHVSLYEKIDDLKLRLGGDNSHFVGVFLQLLSTGKVRVGFRDKTERLSLADPQMLISREQAISLIDSYLAVTENAESDPEPNPITCRLIVR